MKKNQDESSKSINRAVSARRALLLTKRATQALPTMFRLYDDVKYKSVLIGDLTRLPPINSKVIRIFLSSTFSDMATERNVLMKSVYPKLKEYCRDRHGVEFQVIDMRWGVREESQLDHQGSELCYQEVFNCQNISVGPPFIALLGQRYGRHPPPATLSEIDFKTIVGILEEMNEDVRVIKEWYLCDHNNIPETFHLKPVVDLTREDIDNEEMMEAKKRWYEAETEILELFDKAVENGLASGKLTNEQAKIFMCSVTEKEIHLGIVQASSKLKEMTSVFIREIEDLEAHLNHPKIYKFIDLLNDDAVKNIDQILREKMNQLKETDIINVLSKSAVVKYKVTWSDGINEDDHKEYLETFSKDFYEKVCNLVDRGLSEKNQYHNDDLYSETLQHSHSCVNYVTHFQGRQDVLNTIRSYIFSDKREPLVIHGASGSGKTSVLAKAASLCQQWIEENKTEQSTIQSCILIIRFLGTSPGTSSIFQTLKYLCRQMVGIDGDQQEIDAIAGLDNFKEIMNTFYDCLESVASPERPVFVFLDSIDQLNSSDSAYQLNWLRMTLPENVKMILSTLPDMFNLLTTFRATLPNDENYVEVKPLEENLCCDILRSLLQEKNRTLTEDQWSIAKMAFSHCSLPIYVNLVYHQVLSWRSYDHNSDILSIDYTVRGAIRTLFKKLEKKHGKIFTCHSLAYITASRNGLSEAELEDLLSVDDVVLRDVFQYHLPPLIRIPPFCWSRLRHDIGAYLVEREADNTRVLFWYHRQFIEVAQEYFLSDREFLKMIHSNMADYFLGIWGGGKPKTFEYPKYLVKKLKLAESSEADRMVPLQPYLSENHGTEDDSETHRYNLRKLNELPFHLVKSGRFEDFYENLAFNYEFLFNKLRGTSRQDLLVDLVLPSRYLEALEIPPELNILINAIRIAAQALGHDPISLNTDLIGRLFNFEKDYPRIGSLLKQCRTIGRENCVLIPLHNCFESGSGVLHTTFDLQMGIAIVTPLNTAIVISMVGNDLKIFDMDGNELSSLATSYSLFHSVKLLNHKGLPQSMVTNICSYSKFDAKEQEKELIHLVEEHERKRIAREASNLLESEENENIVSDNRAEEETDDIPEPGDKVNLEMEKSDSKDGNQSDFSIPSSEGEDKSAADNNLDKIIEIRKMDFRNGHSELVMEFKSEWFDKSTFSMENVQFVGEKWVLIHNQDDDLFATLISIADETCLFNDIKSNKGACGIDSDETYFFYTDKVCNTNNEYPITIMNLETRKTAIIHMDKTRPPHSVTVWKDKLYVVTEESADKEKLSGEDISTVYHLWIFHISTSHEEEELIVKEMSKKIAIIVEKHKIEYQENSSQCFTSSKYIVFLLRNRYKRIEDKSIIYNIDSGTIINLKSSKEPLQAEELSEIGDETQCQILDDYNFLALTMSECLLVIFDLISGELIRKFKMGTAELSSFLSGRAPGSNLFMISHFPDESQSSSEERMFIMAKVYNLDVIAREANSSNESESNQKEEMQYDPDWHHFFDRNRSHLFKQIKQLDDAGQTATVVDLNDFVFYNFDNSETEIQAAAVEVIEKKDDKGQIFTIDKPVYEEEIECPNKYSESMLSTVLSQETFEDLSVVIPDHSPLFAWQLFVESDRCKISAKKCVDNTEQIEGSELSDEKERNLNDIIKNWETVHEETFDTSEIERENFLFNTPLYDKKKIDKFIRTNERCESFSIKQVIMRPNHDLQLVIVYAEYVDELSDVTKMENEVVIIPGGVRVYDLSAMKTKIVEKALLHEQIFDVGLCLRFFQDGVRVINYKLHIYNIETGQLIRKIDKSSQSVLLMNILLTPDDRFVIGQFHPRPYKMKFDILGDDDDSDDEFYNSEPPRSLQIFRINDGTLLANYMFENEPHKLSLSPCGNFLAVMCFNEIIRFFQIDDLELLDTPVESTKTKSLNMNLALTKIKEVASNNDARKSENRKPTYLQSIGIGVILSEAMTAVVDQRPDDPIAFLAQYLYSHCSDKKST